MTILRWWAVCSGLKNSRRIFMTMTTKCGFLGLAVLFCSSLALAQGAKTEETPTVGGALDHYIRGVEHEFVPAADAMPEDKYSFAPTAGEFKGVRTFSQEVKHVAAVNYIIAAAILQEKPPVELGGENGPNSIKSKADILNFLKGSFAYAHKAALSVNEKNELQTVKNPFGGDNMVTLLELTTWIPGHSFDHYGQMVEYLRMNGIIPPASR
jgi:uncharacterized damage-inducible protein DinB